MSEAFSGVSVPSCLKKTIIKAKLTIVHVVERYPTMSYISALLPCLNRNNHAPGFAFSWKYPKFAITIVSTITGFVWVPNVIWRPLGGLPIVASKQCPSTSRYSNSYSLQIDCEMAFQNNQELIYLCTLTSTFSNLILSKS